MKVSCNLQIRYEDQSSIMCVSYVCGLLVVHHTVDQAVFEKKWSFHVWAPIARTDMFLKIHLMQIYLG
jgi:hypothetical protein